MRFIFSYFIYCIHLSTLLHSHIICIYMFFFYTCAPYNFILILDQLLFVTSQRENRAFGALIISLYPLLTVISYIDIYFHICHLLNSKR